MQVVPLFHESATQALDVDVAPRARERVPVGHDEPHSAPRSLYCSRARIAEVITVSMLRLRLRLSARSSLRLPLVSISASRLVTSPRALYPTAAGSGASCAPGRGPEREKLTC